MELQLLAVVGTKMPIHACPSAGSLQTISGNDGGGHIEQTESESDLWPISECMLRTLAIK